MNGSVDEAVLTDLFGLDSVLSESARHSRQQLATIEAAALTRELTPAELEALGELRSKVPTSQFDRAIQLLMMDESRNNR